MTHVRMHLWFYSQIIWILGFPGGSVVKNPPAKREPQVWSLCLEDPLEKKMATTAVFLLGKSHGQRGLVGYSPWGWKRRVGHDLVIEQQQQVWVLIICRECLCIFFLWAGLVCLKLGTALCPWTSHLGLSMSVSPFEEERYYLPPTFPQRS